jgi:hypothetical protein
MVDSKRINATVLARAGSCRGTAQRIRPELPLLFHRVSLELGAMPAPFVGNPVPVPVPNRPRNAAQQMGSPRLIRSSGCQRHAPIDVPSTGHSWREIAESRGRTNLDTKTH